MKNDSSIIRFYEILSDSFKKRLVGAIELDYIIEPEKDLSPQNFDYAASIEISEGFHGDLIIIISKDSLKAIFKNVYDLEFDVVEKDGLIQDGLNEFLNLIVASSTECFSKAGAPIELGIPGKIEIDVMVDLFKTFKNGMKITTVDFTFIMVFVNRN